MKKKITQIEFVEIWETSESADEAAERLGISKDAAHARASNYRSKGVNLKSMPRKPRTATDVDAMNQKIEEIRESKKRKSS